MENTELVANGNAELAQGDCLLAMGTIDDKSIDMILADLPYASTDCKWDSLVPLEPMWSEFSRVIKDDGAIVLFADMRFANKLMNTATIPFRYDLIWQKTSPVGFLNANKMPLRSHELMLVFYKKLPNYTPQKTIGYAEYVHNKARKAKGEVYGGGFIKQTVEISDGTRHPTSVVKVSNAGKELKTNQFGISRIHPTQKPVDLLHFLIQSYSKEGDIILDPTMGSGSTGVACLNTNRKFIGFELDATYFSKAKERIDNHIPCPPSPRHKDDL